MSNSAAGNQILRFLKSIVVAIFRIIILVFAAACKIGGSLLIKVGEEIEKLTVK